MSEYTTLFKIGATDLVLRMVEEGTVMRDLTMENPIRAIREISHDITCTRRIKLASGREMSAIEIQTEYFDRAKKFVERRGIDGFATRVLAMWEEALTHLTAGDPTPLNGKLDWVTKHLLIEAYRARNGVSLAHPRVALIDLAYHDVNRSRGLYYLLERKGKMLRTVDETRIEGAMNLPPQTTRARLRGEFIKTAKERRRDFTVDWVHLKLNDQAQRTVLCKDPFKAHDERVEKLIASM
jgi:proteasome accessory factor A